MARLIANPDFDRAALIRELDDVQELSDDECVPNTKGLYKPATGEALLRSLYPTVRAHAGVDIWPCNSFGRLALDGAELCEHTDRPGLDWTVSVNVCRDEPWHIEALVDDEWRRFNDAHGAVLMQGIRYRHRRPRYDGQYAYQLFLHYCEDASREGDIRLEGE